MEQIIEPIVEPAGLELGLLMGRREAFAAVAGVCSAVEAESLKRIRDEKLYRQVEVTWEGFCTTRLKSSRRNVERILRLLQEFGPQYFHVAQMQHVTPEEYRTIAPHVSPRGIELDGTVIALIPENSAQVSAAVTELVARKKPENAKPKLSLDAILKRCVALSHAIDELEASLKPMDAMKLERAILCVRQSALRKGARTM